MELALFRIRGWSRAWWESGILTNFFLLTQPFLSPFLVFSNPICEHPLASIIKLLWYKLPSGDHLRLQD